MCYEVMLLRKQIVLLLDQQNYVKYFYLSLKLYFKFYLEKYWKLDFEMITYKFRSNLLTKFYVLFLESLVWTFEVARVSQQLLYFTILSCPNRLISKSRSRFRFRPASTRNSCRPLSSDRSHPIFRWPRRPRTLTCRPFLTIRRTSSPTWCRTGTND